MFSLWQVVLPKLGNAISECEDSICIHPRLSKKATIYKFAVADGATESSFSKEWATLLTESIKGQTYISKKNLLKMLPNLQSKWMKDVFSRPLPYYAEFKAAQGAFSTFIGLQLNRRNFRYHCVAIGDCCFFHLRNNTLLKAFPLNISSAFGNNPFLISSNQKQNTGIKDFLFETEGEFAQGDTLFLMSDAIANWFLFQYEQNAKPWETLLTQINGCSLNNDFFENWLNKQRQEKAIKNDDTSIIAIDIR